MHSTELNKFFPYMSDKYLSGVVYEDGSFNDSRMALTAILTST
jgi:glycerol-3-phosphate dehydrogenase